MSQREIEEIPNYFTFANFNTASEATPRELAPLFLLQPQALREPPASVQIWPRLRTTPHTTSHKNGTDMASRNPNRKDTNLSGDRPHVPEEHMLCQEAQEPAEDAGDHPKAMHARAEALRPPESSRSQRVAAASPINLPASLTPSLGNALLWPSSPRVSGSAGQRSRPRLKPSSRLQLWLQPRPASQRCPGPHKGSTIQASVCQSEDRRTGVTLGCCLRGAGVLLCYLYG